MAHWLDIGGQLGGMTTDIFSEGLQIPILKYRKAGEINQDLVDIIAMNVRLPPRAMGDLRAQITAVTTGERRFLELLDRYGQDAVLSSIATIMDHSEATARALTTTIPDGVYEAESFMDDDGIDIGTPIPIRVRVEVAGDTMTVDLSEVSKQVRGFYNSGVTTGHACAQVAFKCLTSPTDYPINQGAFRNLKTVVPMGRVISAQKPAPMRWWMTFPMTIVDTVFKALAQAVPDRVIAGHHADLLAIQYYGVNPRNGEFFIGNFGPLGGGWGAKRTEDGVSATVCINDGDTHNSPCEQIETKYPVLVERLALIPDSGGPGRHRGGLGIERNVQALGNVTFNSQSERAHCAPWGLEGGLDGTGNAVSVRSDGAWKDDFPNAKVLTASLTQGEAFGLRSGGGGGFGDPLDRPLEDVRYDVAQGYVSVAAAREHYAVVIDPETFALDAEATAALRAERDPAS
jgi:N-methylhydantoinase B